jgi:hypothetical protein
MKNQKTPDIVLSYPSYFPEELIEKEMSEIVDERLNLKIYLEEPNTFMALEWVVPTIFGVYILKPYFNAFLSEAGKDHYQILKKGLKKIVEKGKLINAKMVASQQSPNKLSDNYNQSVVISITIQSNNNRQLKLLFDNDLKQTDWGNAIDALLDFVIESYNLYPNDRLSDIINEKSTKESDVIYVTINPKTKRIEFCNNNDMFIKYKKK